MIELDVSGTKAQRNKSKFLTLQPCCCFGAPSKNDTLYAKYNIICLYTYLHLFWFTVMIRICRQFFLEGHGEKNDTKTIPERYPKTQFESLGQEVHPPTHTLEQCIDTLSALVQRIPIPYFMNGSDSLKRGKEEPNKRTKQSNKFSTSPWQCLKMQIRWIDQIQYLISLVASLDTVPVIC